MSDYETVKAMRDANWKPAVTYWKEKCDQADATIARLSEQVNTLITEKHADAEAIGALRDALAKIMAERDEWKDEYKTAEKGLNVYRKANVKVIAERDAARAALVQTDP